jgi:hypothetical protein
MALLYLLLIALLIFIITSLHQYLWNTTIPDIFTLNPITFWRSFPLILIALILVGGFNYQALFGLLGILSMSH